MSCDDWLQITRTDDADSTKIGVRRAQTFAGLRDKTCANLHVDKEKCVPRERGVRTLPFSPGIFESICETFHVHTSIVKTISRADVPSFASEQVFMGAEAYVYNCRTSNSWPSDIALSATHYPAQNLTFAILYGCTAIAEHIIIEQLSAIKEEACHPLLMPGIVAEIELVRHINLVEANIVLVENKILELEIQEGGTQDISSDQQIHRREEKRTAWLDLSYLRNSLITWNMQIAKMRAHSSIAVRESRVDSCNELVDLFDKLASPSSLELVGEKIRNRLLAIQEEYEEKIRDCSMRLDGMEMATQWSHSETAVEMALATNRESRVMKSISLVTMIFLPGTFFATVFSMTFFDWSDPMGESHVSSHLWVYVVITITFTATTLGLWYYFVMYRRSRRRAMKGQQSIMFRFRGRCKLALQMIWSTISRFQREREK
ncbi:unnamed protein product [Periconia digitata]|uniref:Uncharacterized protein n=1 Tax=Periconia digitata TaxID=1303443 RepID=A0A9W4XQT3_9PLEO|nr:unnamed protein product [Periconia digitata]